MKSYLKPVNLSVHYFDCLHIDDRLEDWRAEDPRHVSLLVEICVGWADWDTSREIFSLHVITNDLRRRPETSHAPIIYVDEFHWPDAKAEILHLIAKCERGTWDESFGELQKRFDLLYWLRRRPSHAKEPQSCPHGSRQTRCG
ncbi:hypothetical protein IHQ71_22170 [Rhizobium sp. TH2]|uniref:Imm8 family immunity protein n=1 Tax=Rhizobium sp. TH2 TaxID=2775403 RepID=UPI0021FC2D0B|nr:hypothetical protein IHQ71_22170 [Rhizobium sp. TH2]